MIHRSAQRCESSFFQGRGFILDKYRSNFITSADQNNRLLCIICPTVQRSRARKRDHRAIAQHGEMLDVRRRPRGRARQQLLRKRASLLVSEPQRECELHAEGSSCLKSDALSLRYTDSTAVVYSALTLCTTARPLSSGFRSRGWKGLLVGTAENCHREAGWHTLESFRAGQTKNLLCTRTCLNDIAMDSRNALIAN